MRVRHVIAALLGGLLIGGSIGAEIADATREPCPPADATREPCPPCPADRVVCAERIAVLTDRLIGSTETAMGCFEQLDACCQEGH